MASSGSLVCFCEQMNLWHNIKAKLMRKKGLAGMARATDEQYILGLCLEQIPQAVLYLIHNGQERRMQMT